MTWTIVNTATGCRNNFVDTGVANIPADIANAVGRGEIRCPICNRDNDFVSFNIRREFRNENGEKRYEEGLCECELRREFWRKFCNAVPTHDRHINLKVLDSSDKSKLPRQVQEKVIGDLKANPDASYAFFGPAGTSKSTYTVALFSHALFKHMQNTWNIPIPLWLLNQQVAADCVWRVSAKALLEDFVAEATGDGHPVVNRAKIVKARRSGYKPCLFIEEIDKVRYSDFKTNAIFELFDAIYENEGQLVFNSNLPLPKFEALFGEEVGPAMVRRIGEMCVGTVYDFFDAQ
jgi:hypothetical protein